MKKYKNILLTLFISLGIMLGISNVHAEEEIVDVSEFDLSSVEIGDKFSVEHDKDTYIYQVTELNTDNIYIGEIRSSNQLRIDHFEVNVYEEGSTEALTSRKFVKLEELCDEEYAETENGESINLCQATKYDVGNSNSRSVISISRQYANNISDTVKNVSNGTVTYKALDREVHYITETKLGSDEFESILYLSDGINEFELDEFDCDEDEELCYTFGDVKRGEAENEKFDDGVLTGDVETLVDEEGNIYVSLRFLSEALGARVDWLSKRIDDDTDAVLIRFYDSEEYCKEFDVEFDQNNNDFEKMNNDFINALKGKENDMSFDLEYSYWDGSDTQTGDVKWNQLFLGGYAANKGYVFWDYDKKKIMFQYNANKSEETQEVDFQEICPSENYDSNGQLKNLDGCIEVMGIIRYYGVPIPIELLREENDTCKFDDDNFEENNDYNNYNDDNDIDDNNDYEKLVYVIGDTHVKNISKLDIADDYNIEFENVSTASKFKNRINDIINNLSTTRDYVLVFNMGNDEIFDIIQDNNDESTIKSKIKDLAKRYVDIYEDLLEEVEDNDYSFAINIVSNMPINNDKNDYIKTFWDYLDDNLDSRRVNFYEIDDVSFKYENNDDFEYTEETYEDILEEIAYYLDLE